MFKLYIRKLKDLSPFFVGAVGFFFTFFPLSNVYGSTGIWTRFILVLYVFGGFALITAVFTIITRLCCSNCVYKKEKTKITFQYKSLEEILKRAEKKESILVVPINSFLPSVGDTNIIRKSSIHYQVLEYLKKRNIHIYKGFIDRLSVKNINMIDEVHCTIGDWFLVSLNNDCHKESGIKFLFLVVGGLIVEKGTSKVVPPTQIEYLKALQNLCEAIPLEADIEEPVYIPLLGAGNADVGKTSDIMRIISEVLIFNKSHLRQHLYVFVDPKRKKETNIFELN